MTKFKLNFSFETNLMLDQQNNCQFLLDADLSVTKFRKKISVLKAI